MFTKKCFPLKKVRLQNSRRIPSFKNVIKSQNVNFKTLLRSLNSIKSTNSILRNNSKLLLNFRSPLFGDALVYNNPSNQFSTSYLDDSGEVDNERESTKSAPIIEYNLDFTKLQLKPDDVNIVLYHGACFDGMGAAWAAWKRLGTKATYHSSQHNRPNLPRLSKKNVALLDIAYDPVLMSHINLHSENFVVLDHHQSSEIDLAKIPETKKVFDMNVSGCTMAWQYFHPDEPVPEFLKYLEDRDIWRWALPESEEFNTAFMTYPMSFQFYDEIYSSGEEGIKKLREEGKILLKFAKSAYRTITGKAVLRRWKDTGDIVNVVNSSVFKSEVGNILADNPHADFSLIWHFDHWKKAFWVSLRGSQEKNIDVSILAKKYGGGGHPKASAFNYPGSSIEDLLEPLSREEMEAIRAKTNSLE